MINYEGSPPSEKGQLRKSSFIRRIIESFEKGDCSDKVAAKLMSHIIGEV